MGRLKETMNCGCVVGVDYNDMIKLVYCSKHNAAMDMYEILKEAIEVEARHGSGIMGWYKKAEQVLAKVIKGK